MRFVKIDHVYYNLDRLDTILVLPEEVRLWRDDDYLSLHGDEAERFLAALDKMIGDGVYVA